MGFRFEGVRIKSGVEVIMQCTVTCGCCMLEREIADHWRRWEGGAGKDELASVT